MTKKRGVAWMDGVTKGFVYSRRSPRQYMTKTRLSGKGKQNYFCCFRIESTLNPRKAILVKCRDKGRNRLNKTEADDGGFAVVWKPASEGESRLNWIRASGIAEHTIVQRVAVLRTLTLRPP